MLTRTRRVLQSAHGSVEEGLADVFSDFTNFPFLYVLIFEDPTNRMRDSKTFGSWDEMSEFMQKRSIAKFSILEMKTVLRRGL